MHATAQPLRSVYNCGVMSIPSSLLYDVEHVLRDSGAEPPQRVALLMRHSVRFPIVHPADTYVVGLTEEGVRLAEDLGGLLGQRFEPGRLRSSPVGRCRATGEAIARGAGWMARVRADRRLSHPFIEPAWNLVESTQSGRANGRNGAVPAPLPELLRWMLGTERYSAAARSQGVSQAARQAYLPLPDVRPLLDVLVTHDTIVGAVAGGLLHLPVLGQDWPGYLEGLLFWWADGRARVRWRGVERVLNDDFTPVADL